MRTTPANLLSMMPFSTAVYEVAANSTQQLLTPDPQRAGFAVAYTASSGLSANPQINLWIAESVTDEVGIVLPPTSFFLLFKFGDWGPIVCEGWWARYSSGGPAANQFLTVYEYRYEPDKLGVI